MHYFALFKFYDHFQYARDFLAGKMLARPLSYFRKTEDAARRDSEEGAIPLPIEDIVLTIAPSGQQPQVFSDMLAAEIAPNWVREWRIFCMCAIHNGSFEDIYALRDHVRISDRCLAFGRHAVVIRDVGEFFKRVNRTLSEKTRGGTKRLVEYYSRGDIRRLYDKRLLFQKHEFFREEKEFRMAFRPTILTRDEGYILDIGDIRDIAYIMDSEDINTTLEVIDRNTGERIV